MQIPLDYETLRLIWWALLGVLLIGFALTDGYDLGVAALLPFVARSDEERRMAINAVAPHWEGHQVWFILGGGAIFAAWPFVYAVSFSGFYLAMFLVLASLILRPVVVQVPLQACRPRLAQALGLALFVSGLVPALVFGVAVGNVLAGAPFRFDSDLRMTYEGSLLGPVHTFYAADRAAVGGDAGAAWRGFPGAEDRGGAGTGPRAPIGFGAAIASVVLFVVGGVFIAKGGMGMRLAGVIDSSGPSNPLMSASMTMPGAWLGNYGAHPWMIVAPVLGFAGPLLALVGIGARRGIVNFAGSAIAIIGIIATVGLSMFPYILPSSH